MLRHVGRPSRESSPSLVPFFRPPAFSDAGLRALGCAVPRYASDGVLHVPFLGGGDALLHLAGVFPAARRIVASDEDASLVAWWVALRDSFDEVIGILGDLWDRVADASKLRFSGVVRPAEGLAREIVLFNARRGTGGSESPFSGLAFWEVEEYLSVVSGWLQRVVFRVESPLVTLAASEGGECVVIGLPFVGGRRSAGVSVSELALGIRAGTRSEARVVLLGDASRDVLGGLCDALHLRLVPEEGGVRWVVGVNYPLSHARRGSVIKSFARPACGDAVRR